MVGPLEDFDALTPPRLGRRAMLSSALWLGLALSACRRGKALVVESVGKVRGAFPDWPERHVEDDPAAGFVERVHPGGASVGRVQLSWEADPRTGIPRDELLLRLSGLGASARVITPATARIDGHLARGLFELSGHSASLVGTEEPAGPQALVWRCDKTQRLVRLLRQGTAAPSIEELAREAHCHGLRDRPVNGDVPRAAVGVLGPDWSLARRNPASAGWLQKDAVFTLFAGQLTLPPEDLVEAAHLAPGWMQAAGLSEVDPKLGDRVVGPQAHPCVRLKGEASLDTQPVRWTFVQWRCLVRLRTYGAVIVAHAGWAPADADWTGRDGALLAARCHGS